MLSLSISRPDGSHMPTIMFIIGVGMILGGVGMVYYFFTHPGARIPGATAFESADFPNIAALIEGFALFAFGAFLFALGLGWMLAGTAS